MSAVPEEGIVREPLHLSPRLNNTFSPGAKGYEFTLLRVCHAVCSVMPLLASFPPVASMKYVAARELAVVKGANRLLPKKMKREQSNIITQRVIFFMTVTLYLYVNVLKSGNKKT
jgi:hypothetical protein